MCNTKGVTLGLQHDLSDATSIFLGIAIHACLLSSVVSLTTLRAWVTLPQLSLKKCALIQFVMCLFRPIGILCGLLVQSINDSETNVMSAILMSLSTGVFLHVTFLSLIPAEFSNKIGHCTTNLQEPPFRNTEVSLEEDVELSLESEKSICALSLKTTKEATTIFQMVKVLFFVCGWLILSVLTIVTGGHHHWCTIIYNFVIK